MRFRLLYLVPFCLAAACWGEPPYSCADYTTMVYVWNGTWRQSGNWVYAYAATSIEGAWSSQWQLYQSTWLYKDQTLLDSWLLETEGAGGVPVEVTYWAPLNQPAEGPGTYRLDGYHSAYAQGATSRLLHIGME